MNELSTINTDVYKHFMNAWKQLQLSVVIKHSLTSNTQVIDAL